jgi:hypothetical protein
MADDQNPNEPVHMRPGGGGNGSDPSHVLSRKELRAQAARARSSHSWWYVLGAVAVVLVVGVVVLVATSKHTTASVATKPVVSTSTSVTAPVTATCPLTGTPAPGGTVPQRPALGVKIGNYTSDRPSAGLNQADVVFEEPVEGAITRLLAVFQCQSVAMVGDLRSAREPDAAIMSQLSHPLFAHAGGINPVLALMQSSPLTDLNLLTGRYDTAIHPVPGRYPPYSFFTNTAALWAFAPSDVTPPAPIFTYSTTLPAGAVAGSGASVHIPFSSTSDVRWTWSPSSGTYLRSYSGAPDILVGGAQTATTNVVIMSVQTATGTWVENSQGGREVLVTATGSGPLLVMRNGTAITGTWSRSSLTSPATLTTTGGAPITLQPGNTWEELVPSGVTVTPTASPSASGTAG